MLQRLNIINSHQICYSDNDADLRLEFNPQGDIEVIEYRYGKRTEPHVLVIKNGTSIRHMKIEPTEKPGERPKNSPIYALNGQFNVDRVVYRLLTSVSDAGLENSESVIRFVLRNVHHLEYKA